MHSVQAQLQPAELGPLRDFDQSLVFEEADLDFLDELVGYPYNEELQLLESCGTASPGWDMTTASSFGIEMTHSPQQMLLADQHRPQPLLPNAKERTKELNRRHQKRFREKRKVTAGLVDIFQSRKCEIAADATPTRFPCVLGSKAAAGGRAGSD
jgi:hypothetical protein